MSSITSAASHSNGMLRAIFSVPDRVRILRPWRANVLAFVTGLLSALAFAPFEVFPLLLAAFAVLVLLIERARQTAHPVRAAALAGWMFGFGHFLAGLYWVGYAFTVDAAEHAWQIPFVETLLPAGLALFPAAACAAAAAMWRQGGARIFLFAACYGIAEWLRGHVLTGFPWNLPAYAWGAAPPILQSSSVIGAYGLSLLTVLLGASFAECTHNRWRLPAAATTLFALMFAAGGLRLLLVPTEFVSGVQLRLVQPNVRQQDKYVRQYRARNWRELIALSTAPAPVRPTHIIWPEAAPPVLLARSPEALEEIAALTGRDRVLMTGAVRIGAPPDDSVFNSFYIFGHDGLLVGTYDKFHLVPGGEYLPFSDLLTRLGISKLVDSPGSFTPGDGPHTFKVPGAPAVGPLICYEILFPSRVTTDPRPGWLVNVTDDSWFGPSTGPYQHLLTARVRAIEEGLPVARAANTGISAVIDPVGRIVANLSLGKTGVVDSRLPRALPTTPYARFRPMDVVFMVVFCALGALWSRYVDGQRMLSATGGKFF